jgi:hypothetical protein
MNCLREPDNQINQATGDESQQMPQTPDDRARKPQLRCNIDARSPLPTII